MENAPPRSPDHSVWGFFCGGRYRTRTATTTTAACGRNREELLGPWPAGCKAHSRAVAYAGSHNPSRGEGVSRGREGGVETPLSPSGPAERPRRRCRLQKASDLPYAATLCAGKDDLELPPLCSGNNSGNKIFRFATLENLRIFQSCFFTGGVVPGSCIRCCWPAAKSQHFSVPACDIKTFCCYI